MSSLPPPARPGPPARENLRGICCKLVALLIGFFSSIFFQKNVARWTRLTGAIVPATRDEHGHYVETTGVVDRTYKGYAYAAASHGHH